MLTASSSAVMSARNFFFILTRAAFATLLIGGCRQLVGIDSEPHAESITKVDAGPSPSKLTCGGYVFANDACAACGVAMCCEAATACASDGECAALVDCERACAVTDDDCLGLCELAHPNGVSLERTLGACTTAKCASSCITPQWACLEHPVSLPPPVSFVTILYRFSDYATTKPIPNVLIRICGGTDFDCAVTQQGPFFTDAQGLAVVETYTTPGGTYTELSAAGYPTILVFFPIPSVSLTLQVPLPNQMTYQQVVDQIAAPQPDRGMVLAIPHDCTAGSAAGVSFSVAPSDGTTPWYFKNSVPSASATETDSHAGFSAGGYVNVKSLTALTLGAKVVENGLAFPTAVPFVRPGGISYVFMYASPP
jgi:hypothetical protein